MKHNPLLQTDVYKLGHMSQYAPGTQKVYSYLTARSTKNFDKLVFFGLQYYLQEYLQRPITNDMVSEFFEVHQSVLGPVPDDVRAKVSSLQQLGYWPVRIKAVKEGTVIAPRNVLMTITNTHPDFYWCVGFLESLLLKVWYPITVASCCYRYRKFVEEQFAKSVDTRDLIPFMVHDFGYRGDQSEEGAAVSGGAHLLSFMGSDTIPAYPWARTYYNAVDPIMLSVPASEHSVMCSFGREDELAAFRHMLNTYPKGIVSIVSDTFNVYRVLTEFAEKLKPQIMDRDGKVVFRPDSGDPETIICGDPSAEPGTPENLGCIQLLDRMFGSNMNKKGYKELNPKVGLIYGDGMYFERYQRTINRLAEMGYAASNLVIGVGGILRAHTRDTLGFAIKATYVETDNGGREIEKDPVTDHKKKSHKGLMRLSRNDEGFYTVDQCSHWQEEGGLLRTVFEDGRLRSFQNFADIRQMVNDSLTRKTVTGSLVSETLHSTKV